MMKLASYSFWDWVPFSRHLCITQQPCLCMPISTQFCIQASKINWVYWLVISLPARSWSAGWCEALKIIKKAWMTWLPCMSIVSSTTSRLRAAITWTSVLWASMPPPQSTFAATLSIRVCTALVPWILRETSTSLGRIYATTAWRISGSAASIIFWQR